MWTSNEVKFEQLGSLDIKKYSGLLGTRVPGVVSKSLIGGIAGGVLGVLIGLMVMSASSSGLFAAFGVTLPVLFGICLTGAGSIVGSFADLLRENNDWRTR
jgi:hypothetical protein